MIKKINFKFCIDKIWIITFICIVLKCIIFLGFTLDKTVASSYFISALKMSTPRLPFYLGFTGIFLCFAFLLKGRSRLWSLICFNSLLSLLLLVDLWYYRGFSTMTTFHLLQQTSNLDNLSGTVFSMIHAVDLILIADIAILIPIAIRFKNLNKHINRTVPQFLIFFIISLSIVCYIPVKVNIFGYSDDKALYSMLDANITAYNLSPIGYHILNTYSYIKDNRTLNLSREQRQEITEWITNKEQNLPDNNYKGLLEGKNLIVIQLESFESFVIQRSVNGQELTPNINKLLKNSINFTNVYEQVNQGTTSDAEFMLNTAIYPLRQGSTFFRFPYNSYNSLPKLLENKGYSTVAIHSDAGSYWNWMISLSSIGFQDCLDSTAFNHDESIGMGLSDGSYLKQIVPILKNKKQPFYSFIVTLSNHAPFNLPANFRELKLDKSLDESTMGGYFQSVKYVDTQIGNFIENLDKTGLLDNSVVVLHGDHEGIHKYYQKDVNNLKAAEEGWLDNNKHLPFIVYSKGLTGEDVSTIGGQIDVMPTISYLLGVDEINVIKSTSGRNLLKTDKSFVVLRNTDFIGNSLGIKDSAVKGLEIADTIIRSNYFLKD